MKVASVFSGIGGLDLGFKNAGFGVEFANEWERGVANTYKSNLPDVPIKQINFRDLEWDNVKVDGLIGAPPILPFDSETPDGDISITKAYAECLKQNNFSFICLGYGNRAVFAQDFNRLYSELEKLYNLMIFGYKDQSIIYGVKDKRFKIVKPLIDELRTPEIVLKSTEGLEEMRGEVIYPEFSYRVARAIYEAFKI